jgi:hypothetical protein
MSSEQQVLICTSSAGAVVIESWDIAASQAQELSMDLREQTRAFQVHLEAGKMTANTVFLADINPWPYTYHAASAGTP